ncbi:hypothetical protein N9Z64_02090 [bacterium]|nr:hypothetical protein [bacterium]
MNHELASGRRAAEVLKDSKRITLASAAPLVYFTATRRCCTLIDVSNTSISHNTPVAAAEKGLQG